MVVYIDGIPRLDATLPDWVFTWLDVKSWRETKGATDDEIIRRAGEIRNCAQRTWRAKKRKHGLTEVRVWVPPNATEEIRSLAAKLREMYPVQTTNIPGIKLVFPYKPPNWFKDELRANGFNYSGKNNDWILVSGAQGIQRDVIADAISRFNAALDRV